METTDRERIYLAAMLHDIGKFYQRADSGNVIESKYLNANCKNEASFCPSQGGHYTHKHVLWTAQFITENLQIFNKILNEDTSDFNKEDNILNIATKHHLPKDKLSEAERIIKEADSLSSGMDRDSEEAFKDDVDETNWDSFIRKCLIPIVQTVHQDNCHWWYQPVSPLSLTKDSFPKERITSDPDYKGLWDKFVKELKSVPSGSFRAYTDTLLSLLFKYSTCIPTSTINLPDVSLYDHLKTTAAIAVCLFDFYQSKETSEEPFLLIGGDFSGIQKHIYQIVSKYASKNLKGRSFYIRLISDAIVRFILKKLNLYNANVIYNSGGGFYILAPNTRFTIEALKSAISEIELKLFNNNGVSLYVAIDSVRMSKDVLLHQNNESIGEKWNELFLKKDKIKYRKYENLIGTSYDRFFEPSLYGGDRLRDTITGEELSPEESILNTGDLHLKKETADQITLGEILRDTKEIVISEEELECWKDNFQINPIGLGFHYYFLNDFNLSDVNKETSIMNVTAITLNGKDGDCNFLSSSTNQKISYCLEFYGGNEFNGNTFERMCQSVGFSRLGILRMDVDNLGSIFQRGIKPEKATLSRYCELSRSFDYFFSGYINTIWKNKFEERSCIIYSGGDDLFIVGSWETTIAFAKAVHQDFKEYSCNNPSFSISGGIALVDSKYPISRGAIESADEETASKSHTCLCAGNANKNSISFFDTPLNWNEEFNAVEALKCMISDLIAKGIIPKSFISKILGHAENANIKNHIINKSRTYWMLTYDMSRMKERLSNSEAKELVNQCILDICANGTIGGKKIKTDYNPLELWAFACRWAELENRII